MNNRPIRNDIELTNNIIHSLMMLNGRINQIEQTAGSNNQTIIYNQSVSFKEIIDILNKMQGDITEIITKLNSMDLEELTNAINALINADIQGKLETLSNDVYELSKDIDLLSGNITTLQKTLSETLTTMQNTLNTLYNTNRVIYDYNVSTVEVVLDENSSFVDTTDFRNITITIGDDTETKYNVFYCPDENITQIVLKSETDTTFNMYEMNQLTSIDTEGIIKTVEISKDKTLIYYNNRIITLMPDILIYNGVVYNGYDPTNENKCYRFSNAANIYAINNKN